MYTLSYDIIGRSLEAMLMAGIGISRNISTLAGHFNVINVRADTCISSTWRSYGARRFPTFLRGSTTSLLNSAVRTETDSNTDATLKQEIITENRFATTVKYSIQGFLSASATYICVSVYRYRVYGGFSFAGRGEYTRTPYNADTHMYHYIRFHTSLKLMYYIIDARKPVPVMIFGHVTGNWRVL